MSLTSSGVQGVIDPTQATDLARSSNDYAHAFVKKYPDHFASFATVALQNPKGAADELERAVSELGFKEVLS